MKTAMQNSKIRNTLILIYILAVLGFSASARAEMNIQPIFKTQAVASQVKTLIGEMAVTPEGATYLVISDEVFYELRGAQEDLTVFNGQRVQVRGYELMHRGGPVYQLSAFNPLLDEQPEQTSAPVLVVLQIRGLTQ